jgi:hypothetical protein
MNVPHRLDTAQQPLEQVCWKYYWKNSKLAYQLIFTRSHNYKNVKDTYQLPEGVTDMSSRKTPRE